MKSTVVWALLALAGTGCGRTSERPRGSSQPPTFSRDVAPILFEQCAPCHRPGQAAPFTLLTYADAKSHASKMARVTNGRHMPPWLAAPNEPAFVGERRLRDDQIDTIQRWVRAGAIEGNRLNLPKAPVWPSDWQLGRPDLVVAPSRPYILAAGSEDVYRNLVMPLSIPSGRFVRAVEFRPGTAPIHHAVIHIDRTFRSRRKDGADGQPGFEGMGGQGAQDPEGFFIGWAPGRGPIVAPDGMPWRLERGTDLVVELHLLPRETAVPVQPTVGLFFTDQPRTHAPVMLRMGSEAIDIPAGERDYAIADTYVLPVDVDLLSVYPHAHYLGKEMQVRAVRPAGEVQSLIHIPQWSFHWQQDYRYVRPIALPRGTVISMRFTYDNSSENEDNPHKPPQPVMTGPRSTDEMGNLLLQVLPHSDADRAALIASSATHAAEINVAGAELLVRHAPESAENQRLLGSSYADVGRTTEAIAHLETALRLDPRAVDAHNDLGGALLVQHRLPEALTHFRQASALAPQDEHFHYNLGRVLDAGGNPAEAAQEFERAIALNPEFAEAHDNLGVVLFTHNRLAEALAHFRRAAELAPDSPDIQNDLGGALAEAGQYDEAMRHVRRALELNPAHEAARENLVRLQRHKEPFGHS